MFANMVNFDMQNIHHHVEPKAEDGVEYLVILAPKRIFGIQDDSFSGCSGKARKSICISSSVNNNVYFSKGWEAFLGYGGY